MALANRKINLSDKTITTTQGGGTPSNAVDGNWDTYWETWPTQLGSDPWWRIDMGSIISISKLKYKYSGYLLSGEPTGFIRMPAGVDEGSLIEIGGTDFPAGAVIEYTLPTPANYRYIGVWLAVACEDPEGSCKRQLYELEVYESGSSATQTTAPTQIDGGTNFWQWESFTDTKTVPANTSVTYRYRTSSDSTTWTSWVGAIGSVTSRVGDTKYRYLEVEATLANTDGASTPTIDQYDIGYHTETKPNKPTAQTAVTQ